MRCASCSWESPPPGDEDALPVARGFRRSRRSMTPGAASAAAWYHPALSAWSASSRRPSAAGAVAELPWAPAAD